MRVTKPKVFSILIAASIAAGLVVGTPARAQVPRVGVARSRATVLRARGGERVASRRPPAAPAALTAARRLALLQAMGWSSSEPGETYFRVTPSQPSAANRAALVFAHADIVEGGSGWASFTTHGLGASIGGGVGPSGFLALWIKSPAAGRKFLVDCTVSAEVPGQPTTGLKTNVVVTGPGDVNATVEVGAEGHALFLVETQDTGWSGFNLAASVEMPAGNPFGGAAQTWTLYSCEATNL